MNRIWTFLTALALSGTGALFLAGQPGAQAMASDQSASAARGARAWAENCASCHNVRSPGELGDAQWVIAATHMRVRANIPGDVTRDIIAFLRAGNDQPTDSGQAPGPPVAEIAAPLTGDPERGALVYRETCAACHGDDGRGAVEGVPDLVGRGGRLAQPDAHLMQSMINGLQSPGSSMPMPARGGNPDLTDQDLADALAYLRRTSRSDDQ